MTKSLSYPKLFVFVAIISAGGWGARYVLRDTPELHAPAEAREEEEEKSKREKWMEDMHRAAPGTDWRAIEALNRYARQLLLRPAGKVAQQEVLANGHLTGEWRERGCTSNTGRIVNVDYDVVSGKVYCASDGGNIWKGDMNGSGWTVLNDKGRLPTRFVNVLPLNGGKRILTGGDHALYYSDNDGSTWQNSQGLTNYSYWGSFKKTVVVDDAAKTVYLLLQEWDYVNWYAIVSLYKSTNKGQAFSLVRSYPTGTYGDIARFDIWAPRIGNPSLLMVQNDSVFDIDLQTNQFNFTGTFPLANAGSELITGYRDNVNFTLYVLVGSDLYRSVNGGFNWAYVSNTGINAYDNYSFSCSLADPDHLFLGNVECFRSFDHGQSWTKLNDWWDYNANPAIYLHADIHAIMPYRDNNQVNRVFVCTDGSVFDSNDDLQSTANLAVTGLNCGLLYDSYTNRQDPNYIYVGTQDQGYLQVSSDPGGVLSFAQQITGDYGHLVSSDGGNTLWMNYPGFTRYVFNPKVDVNGYDWDFQAAGFNRPLWIPPMMAHPTNSNICFIAGGNLNGTGSHMVQLQYSGGVVGATELPFDFEAASQGGYITAMAYSPIDHNYRYVLTDNGHFFYSSNGGNSWTASDSTGLPGTHWFYGAAIYPSKTTLGTVYIGGSGYSNPPVYRSTNHGQGFTNICSNNGMPSTLVHRLTGTDKDSLIIAATESGPYAYVPSENKWYNISGLGGPDQNYWNVDYVPAINTLRFATHGRGMWDLTMPSLAGIKEQQAVPAIGLFPNPASDRIYCTSGGELTIYNPSGQEVLKRTVSAKEAIDVSVLSSGLYFYRLETQGKKYSGKWIRT